MAPDNAIALPRPPHAGTAERPVIVQRTWVDSRTVDLRIASRFVHAVLPVRVLLPRDGHIRRGRRRPVLLLLQGGHDDYTSWTRETDVAAFTADKGLLTVMPSTGPTGIPTRWSPNNPEGADYEKFLLVEVMGVLERDFNAGRARAVAGVSTGGYGAMALAARHPGAFRAAASYSGILHTTAPLMPELVGAIVAREGLDPDSLWGSSILQRQQWEEYNPYRRAEGLAGTALYVSSGTGGVTDEAARLEALLYPAAEAFALRLSALHIPATVRLYHGGGHSWPYWQRQFKDSWPLIERALG
ncbi:alpha/beta hydrolase [Streptomyces sp. NPDC090073]|uniref:alpha/beta hydrolase n=1 Tax=Streptomyces sp. NPDC090073 TaxID=3365936 RepID=UPI0038088EDF